MHPGGYHWVVQLERQGVYKAQCTGWNFVVDNYSKRTVKFLDLEEAIFYCRQMG